MIDTSTKTGRVWATRESQALRPSRGANLLSVEAQARTRRDRAPRAKTTPRAAMVQTAMVEGSGTG